MKFKWIQTYEDGSGTREWAFCVSVRWELRCIYSIMAPGHIWLHSHTWKIEISDLKQYPYSKIYNILNSWYFVSYRHHIKTNLQIKYMISNPPGLTYRDKWRLIKEGIYLNICPRVLSYLSSFLIVQQNRMRSIFSLWT